MIHSSIRPLVHFGFLLAALIPLRAATVQSVYYGDYNGVLTELSATGTIIATRNLGAGVIGGLTRDAAEISTRPPGAGAWATVRLS